MPGEKIREIHIRQSQLQRPRVSRDYFICLSVIINYDFDLSVFIFPKSGVKILLFFHPPFLLLLTLLLFSPVLYLYISLTLILPPSFPSRSQWFFPLLSLSISLVLILPPSFPSPLHPTLVLPPSYTSIFHSFFFFHPPFPLLLTPFWFFPLLSLSISLVLNLPPSPPPI